MPTWLQKVSDVMGSKWWPWVVLGVIGTLMVIYFIYAWLGYAPTDGPDHTNPWPDSNTARPHR